MIEIIEVVYAVPFLSSVCNVFRIEHHVPKYVLLTELRNGFTTNMHIYQLLITK